MGVTTIFRNFLANAGFLDKRCLHCLSPFLPNSANQKLCGDCAAKLQLYNGPRCIYCGLPPGSIPLMPTSNGVICSRCLTAKPAWNKITYYGLYEGMLKDLLLRFKFEEELRLAPLFGEMLYYLCAALPKPDFITAIPQHLDRLRKRGFNQAHEIAKALAKLANLRVTQDILGRKKKCLPQEKLTAAQRKANLAGAFIAKPLVLGKHIWLVDDILTTGATCNEAALTLSAIGAASVNLLLIARTPV